MTSSLTTQAVEHSDEIELPEVRTELPGPRSREWFDRADAHITATMGDHSDIPFVEASRRGSLIVDVDGNTFVRGLLPHGSKIVDQELAHNTISVIRRDLAKLRFDDVGVHSGRAEQEAAGEIGEDRRLAKKLGCDPKNPGDDNGEGEVLD